MITIRKRERRGEEGEVRRKEDKLGGRETEEERKRERRRRREGER